VQTTVGVPQLSVAEGLAKVTVVQLPEVIRPIPIIGAQEICGGSVSLTVTVNEQAGPAAVVQSTVVVPTGKNEPDAGVQLIVEQYPLSVGENVTLAPHWPASLG